MLIANPSFEGHFRSMPISKCEYVLPTFEVSSFRKTLNVNDASSEKNVFTSLTTGRFKLKSVLVSIYPCKGAHDRKFGRNCFCMKQQIIPGNFLSFKFAIKDYSSLAFKPFTSLRLTNFLVSSNVVDSYFEHEK